VQLCSFGFCSQLCIFLTPPPTAGSQWLCDRGTPQPTNTCSYLSSAQSHGVSASGCNGRMVSVLKKLILYACQYQRLWLETAATNMQPPTHFLERLYVCFTASSPTPR
jgi:hypothetical protein